MTYHPRNSLVRAVALVAAPVAATVVAAQRSDAQVIYEPFAYPTGPLDGRVNPGSGQPWDVMSDTPAGDDILVGAASLSNPSLAPSTGGSVTYAGDGKSQRLSLGAPISSGTVYYSMLLQVTSLGPMTDAPSFIAGFSNRTGESDVQPTTVGTRLYVRESAASTAEDPRFNLGVSKNSNAANDIEFDGTDFALNTPLTIVGSYQINGAALGNDDVARIYINPTNLGDATPPTTGSIVTAPVIGTDLFDFDTASPAVAAMVLRQGGGVPGVQVDEVRVDTTWAQVTQVPGVSWAFDGSGSWSENGKWSSGAMPNDFGAFVNLPAIGSGAKTISVNTPVDLRTITITSPQSYTLDGGQALRFSEAAAINVRAGSHVVTAPITLGNSFLASVAGGSTLATTGSLDADGGMLAKAGAGTWSLNHVRAAELTVHGGVVSVLPNGSSAATSRLDTIAISPAGKLDLADNDLIVTTTPIGTWAGEGYSGVTGLIASGRGGNWTGPGIVTSDPRATAASSNDLVTLGVARAGDAKKTTFGGQSVAASDTLVMLTYGGDANLDGKINIDDYGRIDGNIGTPGANGWFNGDFNYDGKINIDDYGIIDANVTRQGTVSLDAAAAVGTGTAGGTGTAALRADATQAVPEPVLMAPGLLAAWALRRGRRGGRRPADL